MKNILVEPVNESIVVSVSAPKETVSVSLPSTENAQIYSELAKKYCDDAAHFSENAVTIIKNAVDNIENGLVNSVNAIADDLENIDSVSSNKNNINAVVSNLSVINTISANLTSINAVNSNKTNIDTVATNITKINSVLNDITNINTVADNILAIDDFTAEIDRIDQSKGKESGSVSTNAVILSDVKKYAHSTFDADKFSSLMSGGASVNDNGIATGFTISGGQINLSTKIVKKANDSLYVRHEITPTVLTDTMSYFGFKDANNTLNIDFRFDNRKRFMVIYRNTNNTTSEIAMSDNSVTAGESYIIELIINGSNIQYKVNGNLIESASNYSNDAISSVTLGRGTTAGYPLKGTTDLKQLEFVINGVPVFSGNKTGLDTVKADDYTVVGTPTISDDGVVSGFSASNQIYKSISIDKNKKITLKGSANLVYSADNKIITICDDSQNNTMLFVRYYNNTVQVGVYNGSSAVLDEVTVSNSNHKLDYELSILNNSYFKYKLVLDGTVIADTTSQTIPNINDITKVEIGSKGGVAVFNVGSIDLNAFKIYVDGDLVYQPCLKIPYTESKTGSKIVDSVYRERVSDMYSQFGYAPYYTLSDSDFTLPMGEIYGMIERKDSLPSQSGNSGRVLTSNGSSAVWSATQKVYPVVTKYSNGTSWYRIYSDGWIEQGGYKTVIAGDGDDSVTLLQTMNDTDYSVQITADYKANGYKVYKAKDKAAGSFVVYGYGSASTTEGVYWMVTGYVSGTYTNTYKLMKG